MKEKEKGERGKIGESGGVRSKTKKVMEKEKERPKLCCLYCVCVSTMWLSQLSCRTLSAFE